MAISISNQFAILEACYFAKSLTSVALDTWRYLLAARDILYSYAIPFEKGETDELFRSLLQVANIIRITAKSTTFGRHIDIASDTKSCTKIESGTSNNQHGPDKNLYNVEKINSDCVRIYFHVSKEKSAQSNLGNYKLDYCQNYNNLLFTCFTLENNNPMTKSIHLW